MIKKIYKQEEVLDKILNAVRQIADPIRQTMGPIGGNVLYEDANGNQFYTNDGHTIAKNIFLKDEVENAIVEIIKGSAMKTNQEAGDGTSSTVLISSILIREGLKMVQAGENQIRVKQNLDDFGKKMKKALQKMATPVTTDEQLRFVANVSSSNEEEIAKNTVRVIQVAGLDGQVMIESSYTNDTELIEDAGFLIKSPLFTPELAEQNFASKFNDVPVLITDKRLYYKAEAESILQTLIDNGYKEAVIVASDFIGEALPMFVANHKQGEVKVILIKESDTKILEDLAIYLDTDVISDKKGSIVNNISIEQFAIAKLVFSNHMKSVISRDVKEENQSLDKRVKALRKEMDAIGNKNDGEYKKLESRISSLTNGMVTVRVGGRTPFEIMEKIYRYEDAINAARVAKRNGYLPGGGLAVYNAFKSIKVDAKYQPMFQKVAEANIRQVAENSGRSPDVVMNEINELSNEFASASWGYNALSNTFEDLLVAGVIEPLTVAEQVIDNAISIANIIVTSRYLVLNDIEELKERNNKK